jgi:galactofuranose transport system permease protein
VMIQALIGTYITFDGTLSSWWAKIATGALLFVFIALQQVLSAWARRTRRPGQASSGAASTPVPVRALPPARHASS